MSPPGTDGAVDANIAFSSALSPLAAAHAYAQGVTIKSQLRAGDEFGLEQPSPVGSGVIAAKFRVDMESATNDSASLKTTTTYDPAALMRMTQSLAQQAGKPIPPAELAKIPPMKMSDDAKYLFDRTVGLMREVMVNRHVSTDGMRRYDGWQIRLLSAPKR
jgi:hypothetical protein